MKDEKTQAGTSDVDTNRRDFLRKSAYAAYATPVIVALLVEKANAVTSGRTGGTIDPVLPPPRR